LSYRANYSSQFAPQAEAIPVSPEPFRYIWKPLQRTTTDAISFKCLEYVHKRRTDRILANYAFNVMWRRFQAYMKCQ